MSLPYPSMVFVPLDILTAEEMNQLVANIESLSAGTGLADGAVTSDKIDSVTYSMGYLYTFASGYVVTGSVTEKAGLLVGNFEARKSDYSNFTPGANVTLATGGPQLARYQIPLTAFFTSDSSTQEWGTDDVIGYGYFGSTGSIEFRAPSSAKGNFNYVRFHVVLPLASN